jgi:hypothetical protein
MDILNRYPLYRNKAREGRPRLALPLMQPRRHPAFSLTSSEANENKWLITIPTRKCVEKGLSVARASKMEVPGMGWQDKSSVRAVAL